MTFLERKRNFKFLGAALIATVAFAGCMNSDDESALDSSLDITPTTSASPIPKPSLGPSCFDERFTQPAAQVTRSVDLLFMMDTSGSMSDNRAKVAQGISGFASELPSNVDYQIAVMLSHGSKSSWSGKLFTYGGYTIFSSKTMDVSTISSELENMVLNTPTDARGEQGEEGSYSLLQGLTTNLAVNKAAGFFRSGAALVMVYVSDENDICAPYTNEPSMPGLTSAELVLRNRDCPGGIQTATVINQVKAVQGSSPYVFGAVVHMDINYSDPEGNDGYGYGYMDYVQATNGVATEINDGDYTTGLSTLGQLATTKLSLVLDYTVASRTPVDPNSIAAYVDGSPVTFVYDPSTKDVHLSSGGGALSTIDITYCTEGAPPAS